MRRKGLGWLFSTWAIWALLVISAAPVLAQAQEPGIYAYDCVFDEASRSVQIRVALTDADGVPLFVDGVRIRNLELPEGSATIARMTERLPVRIITVFDTTRSFPVEPMRDVLQDKMAGFPVLDELALVTFNDRVSALLGPPTIEKLAVIDRYRGSLVPGGDPQAGIAVLYDGMLRALSEGFDPASPLRRVVLVLTDSPHRNASSDTTPRDVIERAQAADAQVFVIALDTIQDTPDFNALREITSATEGHLWAYGQNEGDDKSTATLTRQMGVMLDLFQQALNSEYLITVNAEALEPDPDTLTVPFEISVLSGSSETDLGTFNCVVPLVDHSISLNNLTSNQFITLEQQPLVISTTIDSPLAENDREVRLFLNTTRIVSNIINLEDSTVRSALLPGGNTLKAELYDTRGAEPKLLAVSQVDGLNFQRRLNLTVDGGETVSGETTFIATLDGDYAVPQNRVVRFGIRSGGGEFERLLPTSPDLIGTEAQLTLPDINARVAELFGADAADLQVIAYIDGTAPDGSDALFRSDPLTITLGAAEAAPQATQAPPAPQPEQPPAPLPLDLIVPLGVAGVLIVVNILLLGRIRAARVRRLIQYPDNRELPQNTLRVTVTRDGRHQMYTLTKHTMNIGRGTSNDINLSDDTNISREHGVIMWRRGRWYYANRKGQTRATVGGKALKGYRLAELRDGTQMQIGDYALVCHYDTDADPDSLLVTQFR
jgi:hypothetical protein